MTARHLHAIRSSTAEDLAAQDASLDVTCPWCGVVRDAYCVSVRSGLHLPGRVSHQQRITAARKAATTEGAS